MAKATTTRPPAHLEPETRRWWAKVLRGYELEEHHRKLLTLAAEAWDRCVQARLELKKHGLVYVDRFDAPHPRPEVSIERDSRLAFARLIRELDLDVSPPPDTRPNALKSNRG